jgi:hypothetical protein
MESPDTYNPPIKDGPSTALADISHPSDPTSLALGRGGGERAYAPCSEERMKKGRKGARWGRVRISRADLGGRAGGEGSASWWSRFLVALERVCRESAETLPSFHHHLEDFVLSAPIQGSTAAFARAASLSPLICFAVYLRTC